MALSIPIVSEFDGKGIDKAIKEFKQLETVGEKAQFAIKKAAIPAAAALTAVAGALGLAAKAAAEDEQQQAILANTMQNVVGATDATVAATEDMIAAMSRATGTADSELRPAFSALLVGTKNVGDATTALSLAQDISTATGTDLVTVSDALAKAYAGNMKGLQALSPEMKGLIKDGASLDVVMMALADNFGGAAAASAKTAAGQKNPKAFLYVASTIAAMSTAILALNFAMSLNPVVALTAGIIALSAAMVYLEQKTNALSNAWGRFGAVIRLVLGPLYDVFALAGKLGLIDKISVPSLPSTSFPAPTSNLPPALRFAPQPIVTPTMPTVPAIIGGGGGGGGSRAGGGGTGAGAGDLVTIQGALTTSGNAERIAARSSGGVTINVTGGMSTSAEIGQSVLNSLLAYQRTNGPLDLQIAS
jgi:hypothetical protein